MTVRSTPFCKSYIAAPWRSTYGVTRFFFNDGQVFAAEYGSLLLDKNSGRRSCLGKTKLCYIAGFLFYLSQPIVILFSFQLFYVLFVYGKYMSLANAVLFIPAMLWGYWVLLFFAIARFRWGV
jgi:hypothetical protein